MANTTTLFDMVWKCLVELGTTRTGSATGGTTSTIIDTKTLKNVDNDYYNDGTMFILRDAAGTDAAPQGEYLEVEDFAKLTSTLTARTAEVFSAAIVAGDIYGVANRRFPLYRIIEKINMILFSFVYIPQEDVSLTTTDDTLEYTLPTEAYLDLREVWVARHESGDPDWQPVLNWRIRHSTTHKLVLQSVLPSSKTLRLIYGGRHPDLRDSDDTLDDNIHPDLVVYPACRDLLQEYADRTRLKHLTSKIEDLGFKAERALAAHPLPPLPLRRARVARASRSFTMNMDNIERYGRN